MVAAGKQNKKVHQGYDDDDDKIMIRRRFTTNVIFLHLITQLLVNLECSFVSRDTLMLYSAIKRKLT